MVKIMRNKNLHYVLTRVWNGKKIVLEEKRKGNLLLTLWWQSINFHLFTTLQYVVINKVVPYISPL